MRLGMGLGLGNLLSGQPITGLANKYSFNFDGSNDYLDCGDVDGINGATKLTITAWMKRLESNDVVTVEKSSSSSLKVGINLFNDGKVYANLATGSGSAFGGVNLTGTDWNHISYVFDGTQSDNASRLKLYVNGAVQTLSFTGTIPSSVPTDSATFKVGKDTANSIFSTGYVDEVAVWDTALSADDVAKIASKPVDFSKASTYATDRTSNLKLWLRAGDKVLPENDTAIARQDFYTDFDGTDDYVSVADNDDLSFGDGSSDTPFSISAWINMVDATFFHIATKGIYNSNAEWVFETDSADRLRLGLFDESVNSTYEIAVATAMTSYQNEWVHVCATYDGRGGTDALNGVKIYYNGISQSMTGSFDQGTYVAMENLGADVHIGRYNTAYADGKISNLAIHKTALDAQTISQMAKSRFTPMRDNRFSVVDFDGSNDYMDVGNSADVNFGTSNFSISTWINTSDANGAIYSAYDASHPYAHLRLSSGKVYLYLSNSSANGEESWASTATVNDSSWHYIAVSVNKSSGVSMYIDGTLETLSATGTIGNVANDLGSSKTYNIGRHPSGATYLAGQISSVAVYNVAKSAEEIYAIYQQGITYDESSLSGLQGYWRMGDDTSAVYPTIADSSSNSNDGTITNGASDDIVQQMVAGYDLGAFESSSEELQLLVTDGDWTIGGSWVYDSSTGYYTNTYINGTETPLGNIIASPATTVGRVYKLSYTVVSTTGSPTLKFPNNMLGLSSSNIPYTVGETNVHYGVDDGSSENIGIRSNTGVGTIVLKDIKFEEVLQSEVSDTHPAIIDVNEPVLGAELFTNGWTNDGNGSSYPPYSGSFSYDASANTVTATSGSSGIYVGNETFRTEFTAVADAFYKITFTTSNTDSAVQLRGLSSANHLDTQTSTPYLAQSSLGNANQVFYLKANASATRYIGFRSGGANRTITVSNFSIKQVFGNVGLMTNQATSDLVYSSVLPDQSFLTGVNSAYNFIDLDGSDEYIDCGTGIGNFLGDNYAGDLSLSMWFKADGTWQEGFFDIGSFSGTDGEFNLRSWGNVLSWYLNGTSWEVELTSFTSNDWNHIALVYTAGSEANSNMYLNGSVTGSKSGTFPSASDLDFNGLKTIIGARKEESGTTVFNGKMGQVALYNKALSATEVSAINTLGRHGNLLDSYSDNLLGYWAMSALDAKTGLSDVGDGTIYDRSGNSNHGTATNTESTDLKSSPNAEPNGYAKGDTNRSTTTP